MVGGPLEGWLLLAVEAHRKVPEPTRTIIMMALLGILLLGLLLIVGTMLGAHWVRRQGGYRRGPSVPPDVLLPRTATRSARTPTHDSQTSGDTFVDDDTVGGDDTVVS